MGRDRELVSLGANDIFVLTVIRVRRSLSGLGPLADGPLGPADDSVRSSGH